MTEENQKEEQSNSQPTKEEIEKLEKEISQKQAATLDSVKRDVAESVKKQIKDENDLNKIRETNDRLVKELEESKKASEDNLTRLKEDFAKELEDIRNMKQGVSQNQNPFAPKEGEEHSGFDEKKLNDPETVKGIEEASRQAFIEKYGLPNDFGIYR